MNTRLNKQVFLLTISVFLLSACNLFSGTSLPTQSIDISYDPAPVFWDFYDYYAPADRGTHPFGPPITTLFTEGGLKKQYFLNVLLIYNPNAAPANRITLAPLGKRLNYNSPPSTIEPGSFDIIIDGHVMPSYFISAYQLLGPEITGKLRTELIINDVKKRVELHFDNLGLYVNFDGDNTSVHLLHYGLAVCGHTCKKETTVTNTTNGEVNGPQDLGTPFDSAISRIGTGFLGEPLTKAYTNANGDQEVIFENIVLIASGNRAFARRTAILVGYTPEEPQPNSGMPGTRFIKTRGELGFQVLNSFSDYLAKHGGLDISSLPITSLFEYKTGIFRQCFENLCLDYYADAQAANQVIPAPLGVEYKQRYYDNVLADNNDAASAPVIEMYIWEDTSLLPSTQNQVLFASVQLDQQPVANLELTATITNPGKASSTFTMPLTNQAGLTSVVLPSIEGINGTQIEYEICLDHPTLGTTCKVDFFFIWFNTP